MSFYVKRQKDDRTGWTGPIRSYTQARREFAAWKDAGWDPIIHDSTPDIRRAVRQWQRERNIAHGRTR